MPVITRFQRSMEGRIGTVELGLVPCLPQGIVEADRRNGSSIAWTLATWPSLARLWSIRCITLTTYSGILPPEYGWIGIVRVRLAGLPDNPRKADPAQRKRAEEAARLLWEIEKLLDASGRIPRSALRGMPRGRGAIANTRALHRSLDRRATRPRPGGDPVDVELVPSIHPAIGATVIL